MDDLTVLPVPPDRLRPLVPLDGDRSHSDLNDIVVINRNRLKRLDLAAGYHRNEKRMPEE